MARPNAQLLDEPVVERAVNIKLQCTDAMRDVLDGIALTMGVIVHWIYAPLVARTVMVGMENAVHNGVTEHHIGMTHADLGAQDLASILEFTGTHTAEEIKVFFNGTVAIGAIGTGGCDGAAPSAYLVESLVVDVSHPLLYQ